MLVLIKNTELSAIQHNLPERWLYWIGFSIAQQILPEEKQRASAQMYMDPFSGQGEEEKQTKGKQAKPPSNKKTQNYDCTVDLYFFSEGL